VPFEEAPALPIPFARPFIGKEEEAAALRVLRSGWLTTGREALAFEEEFAEFLRRPPGTEERPGPAPRCLAVNSATSGLHLALEACGVGRGDLVLLPSFTFTSTAGAVRYLGAEPVFVDVAPGTFHLDPLALEETLGRLDRGLPAYAPRPRTGGEGFGPRGRAAAVIPVHYGGLPRGMAGILETARRRGLKVIEDAAHSFPSPVRGPFSGPGEDRCAFAGTLGDAGVFSFYATKTLTTGEGGMVVTGGEETARRISVMRSHGIDRAVWNRYTDTGSSWYYEVLAPGWKYNLPDILAALGRVQLSRAWDLLRMRREIAALYDDAFAEEENLVLPPTGPGDARHLYPLRLGPKCGVPRDEFIRRLQKKGIGVSVHFIPLHLMPYYKKAWDLRETDFPESLRSFRQEVSLPLWPGMTEAQARYVAGIVKSSVL
jgi:dTDP-4-amino-4,6-dideoxygalactose transaminase